MMRMIICMFQRLQSDACAHYLCYGPTAVEPSVASNVHGMDAELRCIGRLHAPIAATPLNESVRILRPFDGTAPTTAGSIASLFIVAATAVAIYTPYARNTTSSSCLLSVTKIATTPSYNDYYHHFLDHDVCYLFIY